MIKYNIGNWNNKIYSVILSLLDTRIRNATVAIIFQNPFVHDYEPNHFVSGVITEKFVYHTQKFIYIALIKKKKSNFTSIFFLFTENNYVPGNAIYDSYKYWWTETQKDELSFTT